jgi:N-acetylmuramoyl-L-alanine amidase
VRPSAIVVHISASTWGDAKAIRQWHVNGNKWSDIGYHAVILNGHRSYASKYSEALDGKIEPGRPENKPGAHCAAGGMNYKSLGVCLIGVPGWGDYPSKRQIDALVHYLVVKCKQYNISPYSIYQHSDWEKGKPLCASLPMGEIRKRVIERLGK